MTKAKKVLSLVLAVVMVAAMFAFSASAATQNATFTVSVDNATVSQNDVIKVTVNLTTDYYAGPTNVPVYYNPKVFEFVADSVVGTKIFGETATDVQFHNDAATGCLKVAFIPNTADGTAAPKLMNGTLFTFQLKAIADGTSEIGLKAEDQKTATNIGGTLYCGAYKGEAIDDNPATVGQDFAITNASATVGSTMEPADLALTEAGAAAGIIIDTHKTFGGQYAGVVYGFTQEKTTTFRNSAYLSTNLTATNGGTFVPASPAGKTGFGTGSTIAVKNADGSDSGKVYVVVIFGDVNCDGLINGADISIVANATADASYAPIDSVLRLAANCALVNNANMMHVVNSMDVSAVANYTGGNRFTPSALAAKHASYNTHYQ
ncbi:MAG: cohesin domain-containing protein [Candidatus Fimenecus sp.]